MYRTIDINTRDILQFFYTIFGLCVFALILQGCASTTPQDRPYPVERKVEIPKPQTPDTKPVETGDTPEVPVEPGTKRAGLTPPFMAPETIKRVAIILPFSTRSKALRAEADGLLKAAELSIFDTKDKSLLLIPIDGGGTKSGSARAAQLAIKKGAEIILGPIKATSVSSVAAVARKNNVPVIGFSNDTKVAGDGVYLLSFPPEADTKRIVEFTAEEGARKFAFLGPNSVYGRRVLAAYRDAISKIGGELVAVETYAGKDITVMQAPAERLARTYAQAKERALANGEKNPEPAFHVVMMPERGTALRSLAPLLPYYDDSLREVQFIGTGRWNNEDVAKEPALNGGVFAGPDRRAKQVFETNFDTVYGEEVGNLSALGYDAVKIASYILSTDSKERTAHLVDPQGFYGVDGFVRFGADGRPRRGLAIFQIRNGRIVELEPAPRGNTDPS